METTPTIQCPSFLRRCLGWFFNRKLVYAFLALLTLIGLLYAVENFRGARAWKNYRQEAQARGVKLAFADFVPAPVPDEDNGANTPFVLGWFPRLTNQTNEWPEWFSRAYALVPSRKGVRGAGSQDDRAFTDLVAWQMAFEALRDTNAPAQPRKKSEKKLEKVSRPGRAIRVDPGEQAEAARVVLAELKPYQSVLEELKAAARKPRMRYPVEYRLDEPFSILLPHLAKAKGLVQEMTLQASAHLAAGQTNEAFEMVQLALWLGESFNEEGFLISQLVRISIVHIAVQPVWEGLAHHQWSEAHLQKFQEIFARMNFVAGLDHSLATERAGGVTAIEYILKQKARAQSMEAMFGSDESGVRYGSAGTLGLARLVPSGWFYHEMASYGRLMDEMAEGGWKAETRTFQPDVVEEKMGRLKEKFAQSPGHIIWNHYFFAHLLMPALEKSSIKFARAQGTAHQALIACALERARLAQGRYPETLAALVPKYLEKIPHEVVSTEAMRYLPGGESFTLYSVAWDLKDDGAALLHTDPRSERDLGDWVWRSHP